MLGAISDSHAETGQVEIGTVQPDKLVRGGVGAEIQFWGGGHADQWAGDIISSSAAASPPSIAIGGQEDTPGAAGLKAVPQSSHVKNLTLNRAEYVRLGIKVRSEAMETLDSGESTDQMHFISFVRLSTSTLFWDRLSRICKLCTTPLAAV